LQKEPEKRLGYKHGLAEIKQHPFFLMLNMEDILNRKVIFIFIFILFLKLDAPFVPEIHDKTDVSNFDEEFTGEDIYESMIPQNNLEIIKRYQNKFKDF